MHVGIARAPETATDPLEPLEEIINDNSLVPFAGQRQHFPNPSRDDARVVYAVDVAVEHARQMLKQQVSLALQDGHRGDGPQHGRTLRANGPPSCNVGAGLMEGTSIPKLCIYC